MSKLKINRVLTRNFKDPYENIEFKTVKSSIKRADGSAVLVSDELIVPAHWSEMACDILSRNYFRKKGVPSKLRKVSEPGMPEWIQRSVAEEGAEFGKETDARMLFNRLAGAWTYWGVKGGYFATEEDARNFYDEMRYMLAMQMGAPNSPQWFNTGVHWAYGIEGPSQGHYYFDDIQNCLKKSQNAYERPQPHACFIQSVKDDLVNEGGIMDLWKNEARLFKFGSGSGSNFSSIRGKGEQLSGGGFSSGVMSFLRIGDVSGGSIKSGGTTRRAAKMVILDIDHPDIEEFINWKTSEENKVMDLVVGSKILKKYTQKIKDNFENKSGLRAILKQALADEIPESYLARVVTLLKNGEEMENVEHTLHWESGAYSSVFGQNSNNTVRVNDEFLHAVENDSDFSLIKRTDGSVYKTLKARYLWREIGKSAWSCADPGLQFDTTINAWNTCLQDDRINASNPCSEYMFLDDTACNLASMNLVQFVKNTNENSGEKLQFDIEKFKHATRLWTIVLEISVHMAQFPSPVIAQKSYEYRTLGLGYGNLGAFLMQLGIGYDSNEGRNTAAGITSLMQAVSYETSIQLAQCLGPFVRFEANKESMMRVIKNHAVASGVTVVEPFTPNEKMELLSAMGKNLPNRHFFARIGGIVADLNSKDEKMVMQIQNDNSQHLKYEGLNILPQKFEKEYCVFPELNEEIEKVWKNVVRKGEIFGFRNAQVSVIAPTGTIGFVMDFKTTGIEPQFAQVTIKSLAGGGVFKIVNDEISRALKGLKYTQQEISDIEKYVTGHKNLDGPIALNNNWLRKAGFLDSDIEKLNLELSKAFSLSQGFNHHVLSEELYARLGIAEEVYKNPDFDLLKHLGASDAEIAQANLYCCGYMTIEKAPHIKDSHLPIFDCAITGGSGKRSLSFLSHIKMMAAVQPFISGAISKTINFPSQATIEDCEEAHMISWKLGLKSVAIYRDGSKYSQVLSSGNKKVLDLGEDEVEIEKEIESSNSNAASKDSDNTSSAKAKTEQNNTNESANLQATQAALQNINSSGLENRSESTKHAVEKQEEDLFKPFRRRGYTQHVLIGGNALWHTTGEDENGKLRNILLTYGKEGSTLRGWASAWGRILSMYLQEKGDSGFIRIYKAFKHSRFEPMGLVQGHPYIKHTSSIPDYIVEDLAYAYPDMLNADYTSSKLPSQRNGKINKVRIGSETMYIIIGEDQIGRPCEVFVTGIGKEGSDLKGWMSACAKLISIYFQDCPDTAIWQFIHAFEGSSFEPSGFIEGHPSIRSATSPLDFLAKHIRHTYAHVLSNEQTMLPLDDMHKDLHTQSLAMTMPEGYFKVGSEGFAEKDACSYQKNDRSSCKLGVEEVVNQRSEHENAAKSSGKSCAVDSDLDRKIKQMSGYKVDEPCKECKSFRLRYNGTCYICDNCFTTTGCS